MNRKSEGAAQGLDGRCPEGGWERRVNLSDCFQSPPKTSRDVLDRTQKVLVSVVRASGVLVHSSFFFLIAEMKSTIVVTGVSEEKKQD